MILASITDLIQLLLNLLSTAIQPPIHLNTKSSPPFFATCQRLNRSTKFKLSILTGYGIFLILNGFWQVKKSSDVTVLASTVRGPDMAIFTWQSLHCNFCMAVTYMVYQYIALSLHSMITTKHILA